MITFLWKGSNRHKHWNVISVVDAPSTLTENSLRIKISKKLICINGINPRMQLNQVFYNPSFLTSDWIKKTFNCAPYWAPQWPQRQVFYCLSWAWSSAVSEQIDYCAGFINNLPLLSQMEQTRRPDVGQGPPVDDHKCRKLSIYWRYTVE